MGPGQLSPVLQADRYQPQDKHCLAAHPMHAEEIPLKRHSDICPGISTSHSRGILIFGMGLLPITHVHSLCPLKRHTDICRGIATYYAHPFSVPTQDAFWYLPRTCYIPIAHSWPHSRSNAVRCVEATLFSLIVIVTNSGLSPLVPTQETIQFIVVDLSLLFLVLNIYYFIYIPCL